MARELPAGLRELLDSGHCVQHSTVDITLSSGAELHLSTSERLVGTVQYLANLSAMKPLKTSLQRESDAVEFSAQNVDMVLGRTLTGAIAQLDGAECVKGVFFVDEGTGAEYFDPQIPGELVAGDVVEAEVQFKMVSAIDAVLVSGRSISEVFPFIETAVSGNPTPINPGGPHGGREFIDGQRVYGGRAYWRYPPLEVGID